MKEIQPHKIKSCQVSVPGSKSYTHRALIAAALSDGICRIKNALVSEDTQYTVDALRQMGIEIDASGPEIKVYGRGGHLQPCGAPIYLGNSGTSMRLLTGLAALGQGTYTLTGSARMQMRPIRDLTDALLQIGIQARSVNGNGCPPIEISGGSIQKDHASINCQNSSQYLSALLLMAPLTPEGLQIQVVGGPVSKPYVDLTIALMGTFGVQLEREGYRNFRVPGSQHYRAGNYTVEADCSQAAYFWSAAAISGTDIKVLGINTDSAQGDVRFVELLQQMGCSVSRASDGISVIGGPLSAIEADLGDMPDQVPTLAVVASFAEGTTVIKNVAHLKSTLAVVASFAEGTTVIKNVAHLKSKESDRLTATVTELNKMGVAAECTESALIINGGQPRGAVVETYNDHRIAMSFAVAGLKIPGVCIRNEGCVAKSFPNFWRVFQGLYPS
jgi:3-phosphoshikimate 1-carboxyvinyltransferase